MRCVFVPTNGPEDWRRLLADKDKHWVTGYSAQTLAQSWEAQEGFPPEILSLLRQHPALNAVAPLLIFPEWKVPLRGGARPSQNDVWVLAKSGADLVSIAVEGKVEEPFDKTLGEWMEAPSPGKTTRLAYLADLLGLQSPVPSSIRYQLLHRTASAVIEAERFGAKHAVMLVHSFSPQNQWFDDFAAFATLFGHTAEMGRLMTSCLPGGIQLHIAWAHGNEVFRQENPPIPVCDDVGDI